MRQYRDKFTENPGFVYYLATSDLASLKTYASVWMQSDPSSTLSFYARSGKLSYSVFKDGNAELKDGTSGGQAAQNISRSKLQHLKSDLDYATVETVDSRRLALVLTSRISNNTGRVVGYIEQTFDLSESFIQKLKSQMNLEIMLMLKKKKMSVGTTPEFYQYTHKKLEQLMDEAVGPLFDLSVRGEPFRFLLYEIRWGHSKFSIAFGASKANARSVLRNVNYAFYTVVGAVILLLTITIIVTSNAVLKPLNELVEATWNIQTYDHPVEIPIKSETEIGLLTESFNHMSRNIIKARLDLKSKIQELEKINRELRDAQAKLVHTSKMISLGQLVAGVAHELNNPIGFIFSNMTHLRDYSNKLLKLVETADKNPEEFQIMKKDYELDYIRSDIHKLISSCEDGARRTRDIVLGLRNFSRLDEAKFTEVDVHEAIDNTLNLISGELKNRIQIHKEYREIPKISCYASQINQVLMNILSNAAQAIEESGNIWITTQAMRGYNGKDMVSISIQDTGKGMDEATMEKIFDPFFSTKEVGQGTGLGLSISYGIIQNHGGEIQVKSQVGIGTEFIINLPVKQQNRKFQLPTI